MAKQSDLECPLKPDSKAIPMARDRLNVVLCIICLLGIASLLPWNVLITQAEFLTVRAHQEPYNQWLADQIISLTANAYLFMNVAAFLLLLPLGKYLSIQAKIVVPFAISALVVLIQAWVAYSTHLSGNMVIVTTLLSSALLGFVTAAMTSATYALATFLPGAYIQALLLGQSVAGVATSVLSFATIWRTGSGSTQAKPTAEDVKSAAIQYFLACAIIETLGIIAYFLLPQIAFVQHHTVGEGSASKQRSSQEDPEAEQLRSDEECTTLRGLSAQVRKMLQKPAAQGQADDGHDVSIWVLTKRIRGAHYLVALAFLVSLAAFPAVVSLLCSVQNGAKTAPCYGRPPAGRFYGNLFQPFIFLLFNVGDAVGRTLPSFHSETYNPVVLFSYSGLRVLLVVGILLCNIVSNSAWMLPHLLWSDWFSTILVAVLGITNGHLATIAFIHAPRFVAQQYRDRVGTVMSFCLTLGLGVGSVISMFLLWWLQS